MVHPLSKIIIYTAPHCSYCRMAKAFFRKHEVEFEERDVSRSHEYFHEMTRKSHQRGVPVVDVGGEVFVGFDRPALEKAIGLE